MTAVAVFSLWALRLYSHLSKGNHFAKEKAACVSLGRLVSCLGPRFNPLPSAPSAESAAKRRVLKSS